MHKPARNARKIRYHTTGDGWLLSKPEQLTRYIERKNGHSYTTVRFRRLATHSGRCFLTMLSFTPASSVTTRTQFPRS